MSSSSCFDELNTNGYSIHPETPSLKYPVALRLSKGDH